MWYQLIIQGCRACDADEFSDTLQTLGALSVTLQDEADNPVLEPLPGTTPLWPSVVLHALFDDESIQSACKASLATSHPHLNITKNELPDKDWTRAWMEDFQPMRFGDKLWVCPSWAQVPEPTAINLMLDPGLAFGTGTHPTTALCLQYLDKHPPQESTVIDFGCGSGILAIAALKLGAKHAYAVDIDEQALTATRANADNNAIETKTLHISFPDELEKPVDLMMANILAGPLNALKEQFNRLLKPQGILVVSGLLVEQCDELIEEYAGLFTLIEKKHQQDWALLVFQTIREIHT